MKNLVSRFVSDESGATAIEYGLIAAGISVAIIAVVNGLGTKLNTTFTGVDTPLASNRELQVSEKAPRNPPEPFSFVGAQISSCDDRDARLYQIVRISRLKSRVPSYGIFRTATRSFANDRPKPVRVIRRI